MRCLRGLMMLGLLLGAGNAFGMNVKTDYDRSFDFGNLKTFTFKDQRRPDGNLLQRNTLVDKRIREALRKDLEAHGYRYLPDGPADFVVAYYARQTEKIELDPVSYDMPLRWRWGWGPRVWTRDYTQGSVIVDFVAPTSNQMIWRGRVTDTVTGLDQSDKQVDKGVNELVKHFAKDVKREH